MDLSRRAALRRSVTAKRTLGREHQTLPRPRLPWGRRYRRGRFGIWAIPLIYVGVAVALGFLSPELEALLPPGIQSRVTEASATAVLSVIAGGMMALTAIVFSLIFILVQFGSTAYSPRLVAYLTREPIVGHSIGMFTATFMYALLALATLGFGGTGRVPFVSIWIVFFTLLGSVVLMVLLIQRITVLQVTSVLRSIADQGRTVIESLYPQPFAASSTTTEVRELPPVSQTLGYTGGPAYVMEYELGALVRLAQQADAVIEMDYGVGEVVANGSSVLRVRGGRRAISDAALAAAVRLGPERTIEQDPKYALRLIVDISIRALSPAINDPTTAVQGLDQLDDLLRRIGMRHLDVGHVQDAQGVLRLVYPTPTWEDFLSLAFDEIRYFGATSVQVSRRLGAVLEDLQEALPPERREAVAVHYARLDASVGRAFADATDQSDARTFDRQGLGLSRK